MMGDGDCLVVMVLVDGDGWQLWLKEMVGGDGVGYGCYLLPIYNYNQLQSPSTITNNIGNGWWWL